MVHAKIVIDVESNPPLSGVDPKDIVRCDPNSLTIGRLERGMTSGKSSVSFTAKLPDGRWVFVETTMAIFQSAASAFKAADEIQQQDQ